MDAKRKQALVAASVAGLLAVAGTISAGSAHAEEGAKDGKVPCYGINKCKGGGECGGKGSSCAGSNECGAKGWISLEKDTCLKIKDGRLTPEPVKS